MELDNRTPFEGLRVDWAGRCFCIACRGFATSLTDSASMGGRDPHVFDKSADVGNHRSIGRKSESSAEHEHHQKLGP